MTKRIAAMLAVFLAGCAIGPDYQRPEVDLPKDFGVVQTASQAPEVWWALFQDPVLNKLVGVADNVKLKEAQVALLLTDNETTEQVAAATGSVRVTDLGMGGLILGRAGGAAGAGWSNSNEGKVIAAAFLDAHNQLVTQLRLLQAKDLPPPVPTKAHAG